MNKKFTIKGKENHATDKTVDDIDTANSKPQRRIQDGKTFKNSTRKMNLDRRAPNSERRGVGDPKYKGLSRRYTIDRRLTTRDRRQAC